MKTKISLKLICLFLSLTLLLPLFATTVLAVASGTGEETAEEKTDASLEIKTAFDEGHKIFEATYTDEVGENGLTKWGYCGFEVKVTTYVKNKDTSAVPDNGILITYVINTNTERVGTDSDVDIITSLLERGYVVAVLDYQNDERAVSPALDWSLQTLRRLMLADDTMTTYLSDVALPLHKEQSYALPAGYNIEVGVDYFNFAEHSVKGTMEHIVDIWNGDYGNNSGQDFLSDNGNTVIPWGQKTLEDGTLVYNDANGVRCVKDGDGYVYIADGDGVSVGDTVADPSGVVAEYKKVRDDAVWTDSEARTIKIKYTLAEDWWDCVKKDGSVIDVTLRMDILYPTNPEREVPVMGLSSSYETRSGDWLNQIRPHMTGFLFAGYAGAMWDHAYTPMARDDHYGYFQGDQGERNCFTLMGYTGIQAQTAAVRRLRYLADTEGEKYAFDLDHFGVYGHSKGCYVYVLGHPDPLSLEEQDLFPDNPGMETYGELPWATYSDGTAIPSNVQMVYGSSGSGNLWGTEGYAPMFISQGVNDNALTPDSAYHNYSTLAYQYDIPSLDFTMPGVGHTIIYGYSEEFDTDMYHAFFKFAHYWLNDANADVAYITPIKGSTGVGTTDVITVKFTGPIPASEIEKVKVINLYDGTVASGRWESAFGNTTWHFTPDGLDGGALYHVFVPKEMKAENGKEMARDFGITFRTTYESTVSATLGGNAIEKTQETDTGVFVFFDETDFSLSTTTSLRVGVTGESINRIQVYAVEEYNETDPTLSTLGALLDTVSVFGEGKYDADISAYADKVGKASPVFFLKAEKTSETVILNNYDTDTNSYFGGDKVDYWIEEDNKSVKITASSSYLYSLVINRAYKQEDLGREITVSFRAYPTNKGNIAFMPMSVTNVAKPENDAAHYFEFETDENGDVIQKWHEFSFTYTVDQVDIDNDKHGYYFSKLCNGTVYLDDIVISERVGSVSLSSCDIVLHNANRQDALPESSVSVQGGLDNVVSSDGEIVVSGADRDHTVGEQSKVYATLSLEDYVNEEKVYLKLNVTTDAEATIRLYGIASVLLSQSFDKENTNYLNAPALDRFSDGVNLSEVYGGKELSLVNVSGTGEYLADITSYVHYMLASGAMYATVILVLDGESKDKSVTLTIPETSGSAIPSEGFEGYEINVNPGFVRNGASGAAGGPVVVDTESYLGKKSMSVLVNETYTRVYFNTSFVPQNFTEEDLGRTFTVSFYIKSDVASTVLFGLASNGGKNNDYNGGSAAKLHQEISVTTSTEWQKVTYTYTVDETMLKSTYESETVTDGTGLAPTNLTINALNGTDKYLFIDEISVAEQVEGGVDAPVEYNFDTAELGSKWGTTRNGSGGDPAIIDTTSYDGTQSISCELRASTARWYLSGITKSDFEDADKGRIFEVTMYVKTNLEAGSRVYVGLASDCAKNNDWNGGNTTKLHQEITVNLTTEWQKVVLTYTVDDTMLKSTYESETVTDGTGLAPTTLTVNGCWNDTKSVIIDAVTVREIDPNAPVEYTYIDTFEGRDSLGYTVNGLSNWTTKVTLTDTENHTSGGASTKAMSFMSDGSSARIYFGKLMRENNVLTEADIGATYLVSFYIKAVKAGSFRVMIGSSSDDPTTALNDTTYTMASADVGTWVRYEYEFTVTEEMVTGNDAFIIMRLSNNLLYFDDIQSVRYVKGSSVSLGSSENGAVSNRGNSDILTLKNELSGVGTKVSYLTYTARGYDELQRVLLNFAIKSGSGESVQLYGLLNATLTDDINFANAPALNADGTVDLSAVYGGAPLASFLAEGDSAKVDVTEYVREMQDKTLVFMLVTEDFGDTVYTNLDFATYTFTKDKDYLAEAEATLSDGKVTFGANSLTLLNIFGNGSATIESGKSYRLSLTADADTFAAYFVNQDGTVSVQMNYIGEEDGAYIFEYTATEEDEKNGITALTLTSEGEQMVLDNLVLSASSTVVLDSKCVLLYDATKYEGDAQMLANMTLHSSIDFNAYIGAFDALVQINGKDKETYSTTVVDGKTYYKVSFANLAANGIALTQTIELTVEVGEGVYVDYTREISIGRYAETVLASGVSDEMKQLILATVDYLVEAARFFDGADNNFEIEDVLDREEYLRPEWTSEGKDIAVIPENLSHILGATVSINSRPGFAVFFESDYEGDVTVMGRTFTKESFHDGVIGTTECKFVYVSLSAYAMLDTFEISVGEDTMRYNLDTYISRMSVAKELTSALYAYASAAKAYQNSL